MTLHRHKLERHQPAHLCVHERDVMGVVSKQPPAQHPQAQHFVQQRLVAQVSGDATFLPGAMHGPARPHDGNPRHILPAVGLVFVKYICLLLRKEAWEDKMYLFQNLDCAVRFSVTAA